MHAPASILPRSNPAGAQRAGVAWTSTAMLAIVFPTLSAFNVAPSATFFNQVAALVGWGAFLLVIGIIVPPDCWPRSRESRSLLGALALLVVAALGASFGAAMPWTLSLSAAGTIAAAILVVAAGACCARAGLGAPAFRAVCVALLVAGVASSAIGLVQVFAPGLPDGDWVALSAIPGRATGNLRQPNHLSSLLLWSIVAAVWLGEAEVIYREIAFLLALVFVYVVVLSASRTGAVGMLTLAGWGLLDRRLSRGSRALLILAPLVYGAMWWGTSEWATHSHHLFGGQTRFGGSGDISSSRFAVWSNTLSMIRSHPLFGVGFGDFNFAWTLTVFPDRPVAFFDHTHNILLNFAVELGLPLAILVVALMVYSLCKAFGNAVTEGRDAPAIVPVRRAAFVIVFMVGVHSMLEYPLWYAYFLLPTAFVFGLCVEGPNVAESGRADAPEANVTRPFVIASMFLILGGTLALYDYMRVVVIFAPPANAGPLEKRIADGQHSVLFAHHADYAAATVVEHPGKEIDAFRRATHFLLDARLMTAWATALNEVGETDKARYVAQRLREFRNEQAAEFFAPCAARTATEAASAASAPAASPLPFQCLQPTKALTFEDFR
jgi:O-antigen ligase